MKSTEDIHKLTEAVYKVRFFFYRQFYIVVCLFSIELTSATCQNAYLNNVYIEEDYLN